MAQGTRTRLWNDSADPGRAVGRDRLGAVGATCNPVIALAALRSDLPRWQRRIAEYADAHPTASESDIGWAMVRELSVEAAALLADAFAADAGRNGRLSVQTDPRLYRDAQALADQAVEFSRLAPNIIVKIPATEQGIAAMEEATYRGVSINATVSFTVPQAVAVAEAIERGLDRRQAEGLDLPEMGSVCTIMVGRLDDWMKSVVKRDGLAIDAGHLEWAGVAAFKKAHEIFRERGFRTRLLSAAFRNTLHWSEFVGGDVVISPPFEWQVRINESGLEPEPRIDEPVAAEVVDALSAIPDFRRAYDVDGMKPAEFLDYGATRKTLPSVRGRVRGTGGAGPRRPAAGPGEVSRRAPRLILLRHGEVVSHKGDQPLTPAGREQARDAGRRLAGLGLGSVRLLSGETRRTRETAALVGEGLAESGGPVSGPEVAFALRNPDLYLAGVRVDMVSSPEAFADQVPGLGADDVLAVPFFSGWFTAPDRIEWWVRHPAPPGDDAAGVAARLVAFAASFGDAGPGAPGTVVGVTHSPLLRALSLTFTGVDPGEPRYLTGFVLDVPSDGAVRAEAFDPFA